MDLWGEEKRAIRRMLENRGEAEENKVCVLIFEWLSVSLEQFEF